MTNNSKHKLNGSERVKTPGRQRVEHRLTNASREYEARDASLIIENGIAYGESLIEGDMYLSPEKAARYLDVSRKFIYEMIARKEIEAATVGGATSPYKT